MSKIINLKDIPPNEEIYLKKDIFGYRIVHPYRNADGSINWKNLISGGSWYKLLIVLTLTFIILLAILEYSANMNILVECLEKLNNSVILINP